MCHPSSYHPLTVPPARRTAPSPHPLVVPQFSWEDGDDKSHSVDVRFEKPIKITAEEPYGIYTNYKKGSNSYYGSGGTAQKEGDDGVNFTFTKAAGSSNGTDINSGMIHSILYRMPPKATKAPPSSASSASSASSGGAGMAAVTLTDHWTWDEDHKSDHTALSDDDRTWTKNGGSTDGARGTVGMTTGVHEWEYVIEGYRVTGLQE